MSIWVPVFAILAGLVIWIVSLKAIPWPRIGEIMFAIGFFYTIGILARTVVRLLPGG